MMFNKNVNEEIKNIIKQLEITNPNKHIKEAGPELYSRLDKQEVAWLER